ncbi:SPOR domain-containing protein, partial [Jannaschia aquimarina]
ARIAAAVDAAEAAAPETEAAPTSDAFPSATIFPDLEARVARAVAATEAAETPAAEAEANGAPAAAVTAQPIGAALPEAVPQAEAMQTAPKADITRQLAEPFIEIGKFRDENEARDAAERMAAAGVTARVSRERVRLRRVWRVVAGPAEDVEGHSAILRTAQEMGYSDAYPVGG